MGNELQNLKSVEVKLLFRIFEKFSRSQDRDTLRKEISDDLLRLLNADFLASFIWNQDQKVFEHVVALNMTPANLARYDQYYQFHDPITPSLQKRRRATQVCEVMPQKELEKTEFFNDFLMKDGLHHGINVYAYDGDLNIGDLRIWRAKNRPNFGKHEATLLDAILPHFRNALRNVRAIATAQGMANLWRQLLENTPIALFLFDDSGRLIYRNNKASTIEKELSKEAYVTFYNHICSLVKMNTSRAEWGHFFFSVLRTFSPQDSRPLTAVMAYCSTPEKIDMDLLSKRYQLSPREIKISLLVCKGLTDQEIASVLGIAFSTVRTHLKHIFMKLDVTTRSELIYRLLEGIVDISF
ncbi:MAG: LuxR C-terminal-related transcriptional regulator [Thermodesulfobacteriota bacterium]|nr:LuxR C-terminal-related transcriptional regulator [Thermodesulfobacteriota bacterium]